MPDAARPRRLLDHRHARPRPRRDRPPGRRSRYLHPAVRHRDRRADLARAPGAQRRRRPRFDVGAVHVSKAGEDVCGDDWGWRQRDGRLTLFVADGLGHGLHAHEAAVAAIRVFAAGPRTSAGTRDRRCSRRSPADARGGGRDAGDRHRPPHRGLRRTGQHHRHGGAAGGRPAQHGVPQWDGRPQRRADPGVHTTRCRRRRPSSCSPTACPRTGSCRPIPGSPSAPRASWPVSYIGISRRRRDDVTVVVARERSPIAEKL